jgi:hypothetical protein
VDTYCPFLRFNDPIPQGLCGFQERASLCFPLIIHAEYSSMKNKRKQVAAKTISHEVYIFFSIIGTVLDFSATRNSANLHPNPSGIRRDYW